MHNKKSKISILLFILVSLFLALGYYYAPKIKTLWTNPSKFTDLILDATELSEVTFTFVLSSFLVALFALLIDIFALGWEQSAFKRLLKPSGTARVDLWGFFLSITKIYELISFVISFGLAYFIASIFVHYFNLNLGGYIENPIIQFLFLFLITDLKKYLSHRFMHLNPFWELHAYHHSAEEFNLLTTSRGNFLERSIYYIFTGLFFAVFGGEPSFSGTSASIVFGVVILKELYEYILHSDVDWKFGWLGRNVLISPLAHKLHHSIEEKDFNTNYGTFFVWWDKIFKTYRSPHNHIEIGIVDNPYNEVNYFKGQWIGIKRFVKKLF